MLSDAQLTYMRRMQNATLVETCDVLRVQRTPDGKGGSVEEWIAYLPAEQCRYAPVTQTQRSSDGVLRSVTETIITLRNDVDVMLADRIVYGEKTYSITGFKDHTWNTARRCVVQLI